MIPPELIPPNLTPAERTEWACSYWTRLNDLCPTGATSDTQRWMAATEATEHVEQCRAAGVFGE